MSFRQALYNALNYSAELGVFSNNYNGTPEAYQELGPLSPVYGHAYYNPNNLSMPTQNIPAAIQNISKAGIDMHFYVTLPNGTKVGNLSGSDLSSHKFDITYISPSNPTLTAQLTIAIDSFKLIGLDGDIYVISNLCELRSDPDGSPTLVPFGSVT